MPKECVVMTESTGSPTGVWLIIQPQHLPTRSYLQVNGRSYSIKANSARF